MDGNPSNGVGPQEPNTTMGRSTQPELGALDLDTLFQEGDDKTWDMDDWNWDPYQMFAEPKTAPAMLPGCHALKRRKPSGPPAAAPPGTTAPHQTMPGPQDAGGMLGTFPQHPQQQAMQAGGQPHTSGTLPGQYPHPYPQPGLHALQSNLAAPWQGTAADAGMSAGLMPAAPGAPGAPYGYGGMNVQGAAATPNMTPMQQQQPDWIHFPTACANASNAGGCRALSQMELLPTHHQAATAAAMHNTTRPPSAAGASAGMRPSSAAASSQQLLNNFLPPAASMEYGTHLVPPNQTCGAPATPAAAAANLQLPATASLLPTPSAESDISPRDCSAAAGSMGGETTVISEDVADDQKMICQVPGCGKDLTWLKDYHQRYRICDVHIRLPQVMKDGRLQRFCQQCGRFHDLSAFDGNRKSCREQLQKHNARRRRRAQMEQNMCLAESLASAVDEKTEVGKLLTGLLSNPLQLHALRVLLGVQTHPALPKGQPHPAEHNAALAAVTPPESGETDVACPAADEEALPGELQPATIEAAKGAAAALTPGGVATHAPLAPIPPGQPCEEPPTYEVARDIMDSNGQFASGFDSEHKMLRLSVKMFNVTPAELPPDLRYQLAGWMSAAPAGLEAFIRPGCVFLTLQALVSNSCYDDAVRYGMQRLLQRILSPYAAAFWRSGTMLLQLLSTVAVVSHGQLLSVTTYDKPAKAQQHLPCVSHVSVLCVVAGKPCSFTVHGTHIAAADCSVVVKSQGAFLKVGAQPAPAAADDDRTLSHSHTAGCGFCHGTAAAGHASHHHATAAAAHQAVAVSFMAPPGPSRVLWVEVMKGSWLSAETRAVLVVSDEELAQEVCALQACVAEGVLTHGQMDALLLDLGLVLQHIEGGPSPPGLRHHDIAEKARRLLAFAADQGCAAMAKAVLPLASAQCECASDVVAAIHASTAKDGLSLLHRAVRSGNAALVHGMLEWGKQHGYKWRIATGGPSNISPLHLAALLDDDGHIALMLLDACDAPGAFTECASCDGVTPFHLAFQMGHYNLDRVLKVLLADDITTVTEQAPPSGWDLLCPESASSKTSRQSNSLDACLFCQTTLPPLLLSIKAHCTGCGTRQPCIKEDGKAVTDRANEAVTRTAVSIGVTHPVKQDSKGGKGGRTGSSGSATAPKRSRAAQQKVVPPFTSDLCPHATGRVLSVTAMCQICHSNRVMEVA